MNPLLWPRLRRAWPALAALAVGAGFLLVHQLAFQPLLGRYRRALAAAGSAGAVFDPGKSSPPLPPRVYTLLMENSLPAAEADQRAQSGALGASMVQSLSAMAGRHGLDVILAEPGLVTPQTETVEVRARLRLRGGWAGFVSMVDELAAGPRLYAIERFMIAPSGAGRYEIEIAVAGCVLKRRGRTA